MINYTKGEHEKETERNPEFSVSGNELIERIKILNEKIL